jgi:hypothetical protein
MREVRQVGEDIRESFIVFSDSAKRVHETLPFKTLKELKMAVVRYRATAPLTLGIIETPANESQIATLRLEDNS